MQVSLFKILPVPKLTVYATHYIYLTPFSYLQALTHGRALLRLTVFPDKTLAAHLRQICLILGRADLFALGSDSSCCPNGGSTLKQ